MAKRLCAGIFWAAVLAYAPAFADLSRPLLGVWEQAHSAIWVQDMPFAETMLVVVHPWAFGVSTTYLITLDGAPLAALGAGQHVIWRTAPRYLVLGMKSRDGLHPPQNLGAEPGRTYYFRASSRGLERTTEAEGRQLVEISSPVDAQLD